MITEASVTGGLARRYVFGPAVDEPLVWYEGTSTTTKRYLDADERGSVIRVTDGSGATLAINSYDEYGAPTTSNSTYAGRFRYTGQAIVPELGMYYYKARFYSSTLGRFMQPDPIAYDDGINMYNYVHADPVNAVDPSGLTTYRYAVPGPTVPDPTTPNGYMGTWNYVTVDVSDYITLNSGGERSMFWRPERTHDDQTHPCTCFNTSDFASTLDQNAESKSQHACATYVRKALEAAGVDSTGHPRFAGNYGPFLQRRGFGAVNTSEGYTAQTGDIVVFRITKVHPYGHIAGFDGHSWVSDFVQRRANPYKSNTPSTVYRSGCRC
jgi:RHS repeat-associated protein